MGKKLFIWLGGLFVIVLGFAAIGHAQQFRSGNNATIGSSETVDSSVYLAGRHVDVGGKVDGDLFCAGQNVTISGTIDGDVICAGQDITISGIVNGDVRVVGQTVTISAKVSNNLTVGAQDFVLDSAGNIGGDITGGVSSMTINGRVGRDMVLGAQDAVINGTVGRNIKSQVQTLSLGSSAKVGGSVEYTSTKQLDKASGSVVGGSITRHQPTKHKHAAWFGVGFRIYTFFAFLIAALVLVLLFPSLYHESAKRTFVAPGRTLLLGIAATLFTPVVIGVLMVGLVGIPLGVILLLSWIVALLASGSFFSFLVGRLVWKNQRNHVWTMLVGAVIVLLVYNIPILGFFATLAAVFLGMGMLTREITARVPKPKYTTK